MRRDVKGEEVQSNESQIWSRMMKEKSGLIQQDVYNIFSIIISNQSYSLSPGQHESTVCCYLTCAHRQALQALQTLL